MRGPCYIHINTAGILVSCSYLVQDIILTSVTTKFLMQVQYYFNRYLCSAAYHSKHADFAPWQVQCFTDTIIPTEIVKTAQ